MDYIDIAVIVAGIVAAIVVIVDLNEREII